MSSRSERSGRWIPIVTVSSLIALVLSTGIAITSFGTAAEALSRKHLSFGGVPPIHGGRWLSFAPGETGFQTVSDTDPNAQRRARFRAFRCYSGTFGPTGRVDMQWLRVEDVNADPIAPETEHMLRAAALGELRQHYGERLEVAPALATNDQWRQTTPYWLGYAINVVALTSLAWLFVGLPIATICAARRAKVA